jgi:hypothetical protein
MPETTQGPPPPSNEYVTGLPSGLKVIKNAPQPDRPDRPVLIRTGTYQAAKAWAIRARLRAHEYRWLSDSTACREATGERWFVDLGVDDAPTHPDAQNRLKAAVIELEVGIRTGRLTLKWWKLTEEDA